MQFFAIHSENPQARLVQQLVEQIRGGALAIVPSDAAYALVGALDHKAVFERIQTVCGLDLNKQYLTLFCRDLSEVGSYAQMDNVQFRLMKSVCPGAYAFVLPVAKTVPNRVPHPKRKTALFRVPDHTILQAILEEMGEPLLGCTLILPEDEGIPMSDVYEMRDRLSHTVDALVDGGWCGMEEVTTADLCDGVEILHAGAGDVAALGV